MIGVLNTYFWDKDPNSYQTQYCPMFLQILREVFPGEKIKVFEIPSGELPQSPDECDLWFISGSAKSVYEDIDWIHWLSDFVKQCHRHQAKLIGLCFGHQMIAQALGGKVISSDKGWGIGIREFDILQNKHWMNPALKRVSLIYSHQDQVVQLPKGAEHLGKSAFCEFEAFQLGDHILSFQGHPEFTKEYALGRYEARVDLIGKDVVDEARRSLGAVSNADSIWQWIKNF